MPSHELTRRLDPDLLGDHIDRLYRAALALCRSRERAEDLVQDTYARVLARPRFLRSDEDLGYLLRVLRNTFLSQQRTARRRPELAAVEDLDQFEDAVALQPWAVAETQLVYETIAALAPHFRDAIVAVDVVGLPYRDAARALGIREGTLTSRLSRGRLQAAQALRPMGEARAA